MGGGWVVMGVETDFSVQPPKLNNNQMLIDSDNKDYIIYFLQRLFSISGGGYHKQHKKMAK